MTREIYRNYITILEKQLKEDRENFELALINEVPFSHLKILKERMESVSELLDTMNNTSHLVFYTQNTTNGELF